MSFLWAFCEFATLTVSSLLPLHDELTRMISQIAQSKLMVWVANSRKAHLKITLWVILRVLCELTECPQNKLTVSFNVRSKGVTCELKFFTGIVIIKYPSCDTAVLFSASLRQTSTYIPRHLGALFVYLFLSCSFRLLSFHTFSGSYDHIIPSGA